MTVHHIVYRSLATSSLNDEQLKAILVKARATNHQLRISGLLLYSEGTFVQVLEGEQKVIQALYDQIKRDPRHTQVETLVDAPAVRRVFPDWSMGFVTEAAPEIAWLAGYVDSRRRSFLLPWAHNAPPELLDLLQQFVPDQGAKVRLEL